MSVPDTLRSAHANYAELVGLPSYTSAHFTTSNTVRVTSVIRDLTRNAKRSSARTLFIQSDSNVILSPPQDISEDVKLSAVSASGKLSAVLREVPGSGDKKRFVEVWKEDTIQASIEVTKTHGAFYTDDYYSSLSFSPSETTLVYTAEANAPTEDDPDPFARFRFVPDLGEDLSGRKRPSIFLVKWDQDTGSVVKAITPSDESGLPRLLGQASFADEHTLVVTGFEYTPDGRSLGVRSCPNRPSAIWKLSLPSSNTTHEGDTITVSSASKVSDPSKAARSPYIFTDPATKTTTLYWFAHALGGAHASCSTLESLELTTGKRSTLVPYVSKPLSSLMDGFTGLYTDWTLVAKPFVNIGGRRYVTCTTSHRAATLVVLFDAEKPNAMRILTPQDEDLWSWKLLATDGESRVLCTRSSPTVPPHLVLATVTGLDPPTWHVVAKPTLSPRLEKALGGLKGSVVQVSEPVETVVIEHQPSSNVSPLVTYIHGGPHSSMSTSFSVLLVVLALEGYTVQSPNYTGSTGYGDAYVQALVGKCGTLDVADVMLSVQKLVDLGKAVHGPGKQLAYGGSHGGFLSGHLVGQHPDVFSAAVLSNPVITAIPGDTDIPDWYWAEFIPRDIPALTKEQFTPALYEEIYAMSPIAHVGNVKVPILLLIGLADRRVANTHGLAFYHALKAQGKEVAMLCFEGENHSLSGVECQKTHVCAAVDWFAKATKE
ncbi:Alpha/Beta hydrolase protein [Amylostereum chailletii]|nr:Alpha/Beta hydrolase protein [Amylostereum chailletii]